jgi:hypothetical protein
VRRLLLLMIISCFISMATLQAAAPQPVTIKLRKGNFTSKFDPNVDQQYPSAGGYFVTPKGDSIGLSATEIMSTPGMHLCYAGCSFQEVVDKGLLTISGPSAGTNGLVAFMARTMTVVLDPSGVLTLSGKATASGYISACEPPDDPMNCENVGPFFVVSEHAPWRYTAHLIKKSDGLFYFLDLSIVSVPEPAF